MTGCERVLARLERGPATAAELYAKTFTVVHSRISELRSQGYVITCERTGGHDARSYLYQLQNSVAGDRLTANEASLSTTPAAEQVPSGDRQAADPSPRYNRSPGSRAQVPAREPLQLSLEAAA